MRRADLQKILKGDPFEPVRIGLSDGRSVLIRHPDPVVVTDRTLFVGLAKVGRSNPLTTPRSSGAVAPDWLWVNLMHLVSVEPANGDLAQPASPGTRKR